MGKSSLEVFVIATMVVVVVASNYLIQSSEAQTSYVVGDTMGWTIPTSDDDFYTSWAANKTFAVGDFLFFKFAPGEHDVAEVKKEAFDDCNGTIPIFISMTGPTNITLNTTGEHFFICTIGSHCSRGQKVEINVSTTATSSPSPPATTAPPPPPSKSSPLVTATALPATLLFIVMTLLL